MRTPRDFFYDWVLSSTKANDAGVDKVCVGRTLKLAILATKVKYTFSVVFGDRPGRRYLLDLTDPCSAPYHGLHAVSKIVRVTYLFRGSINL